MAEPNLYTVLICIVWVLLALVVNALLGMCDRGAARGGARGGGAARGAQAPSKNLVVDTLNLAHWLRAQSAVMHPVRPLDTAEIISAIGRGAVALRARFPGTLTFVLKDQDSALNDSATRAAYQAAAERYRVHIVCAEKYDLPLRASATQLHAASGRDDFYMCLLARKLRCCIATEDRLRDFAEFRKTVAPFISVSFAYWRALPSRDYIRPDAGAFARLRRPCLLRFSEIIPQ
jgi:hypothetical protein